MTAENVNKFERVTSNSSNFEGCPDIILIYGKDYFVYHTKSVLSRTCLSVLQKKTKKKKQKKNMTFT